MASSCKPSNEVLLQQLRDGTAKFELLNLPNFATSNDPPMFARISSSLSGKSAAMKKVEHYSVQKVTGDGRCMFRALVKGMAKGRGITLTPMEERDDADDLRMAVKEVICDSETERVKYEEALIAITVEESLKRGLDDLTFGEASQNYWCCQSCATSQSLCIYQSMNILEEDGATDLYLLPNMDLNLQRAQEK
ncbi:OVARIAN TUMOR DOMAIN-containing deubiquitinating enzyme 3 isoform X2 [Typha latifolia]|uniref:OVARIAN TUMOR DOMAIN-containing deubiquitinating enzyme 3 isoform X2 n=1 Tax=Typha latifolia TaxID=4733 RepID=UPI003C2F5199